MNQHHLPARISMSKQSLAGRRGLPVSLRSPCGDQYLGQDSVGEKDADYIVEQEDMDWSTGGIQQYQKQAGVISASGLNDVIGRLQREVDELRNEKNKREEEEKRGIEFNALVERLTGEILCRMEGYQKDRAIKRRRVKVKANGSETLIRKRVQRELDVLKGNEQRRQ